MAQHTSKPLRLNELDFWEALSRNVDYRQDFQFRFGKPFSALRVIGKERVQLDRILKASESLGTADLVNPDEIPKIIKTLKAGNRSVYKPSAALRGYHENGRISSIKDGRFILVEIDLWAQRPRIETEVWELVLSLRETATPSSSTAGSLETEHSEEIWQVYDAVKGGKSIYRLARERLKARFPANADRVEKLLPAEDRKLRRYVTKATSMIRQVYRLR